MAPKVKSITLGGSPGPRDRLSRFTEIVVGVIVTPPRPKPVTVGAAPRHAAHRQVHGVGSSTMTAADMICTAASNGCAPLAHFVRPVAGLRLHVRQPP
jgi:hypothetical protein